jgi:hypothetical protein
MLFRFIVCYNNINVSKLFPSKLLQQVMLEKKFLKNMVKFKIYLKYKKIRKSLILHFTRSKSIGIMIPIAKQCMLTLKVMC